MNGRMPIGYVVRVDGVEVTLNLLDLHKGHLASHQYGISGVTEVGSLLLVPYASNSLVLKVMSLSFDEPREAHRYGIGTNAQHNDPLRNIKCVVVGRLERASGELSFFNECVATPALGVEVFPLVLDELQSVLCGNQQPGPKVCLGKDLRGGGDLSIGITDLVARHVAVLGSSGQGKSCFTAAVLQQLVRLPRSRVVIFDLNGEYTNAFDLEGLPVGAVKKTAMGGGAPGSFKIPYYALGRHGLHRLLVPSEKTQRPALTFALENLHKVRWFPAQAGAGLVEDQNATLFSDCRPIGADIAHAKINAIRSGAAPNALCWPHMSALASLVAESHGIQPLRGGGQERNAFAYSNISPLITRINRLVEDPMFCEVVDVRGSEADGRPLNWAQESKALVGELFGNHESTWRIHVIDFRRLPQDLSPFVLGSLLELYAYELFERGQDEKIPTLLVLEEAHHYMRPTESIEDNMGASLAYERLAKEGRKFGLALWLSTQRPSEISPTVLSQCNNWVVFRLTSEKDIAAVSAASEWSDRRELKRITGLPRRTAMIFGGSVSMPSMVVSPEAIPKPNSSDADFDSWIDG